MSGACVRSIGSSAFPFQPSQTVGIAKRLANVDFEDPEQRAYNHHKNMSRNEQTTIGAILEMTPGDRDNPCYINDDFHARVAQQKQRQGPKGAFYTGTLVDDDTGAQIAFSCFGRKVFPPAGSLVNIGGQGITLGEYNGTPQLTIGQKATVNRVNANVAGQGAPPGRSAPPAGTRTPPARNLGATGQRTPAINGQTVGMAMKEAIQLALRATAHSEGQRYDSDFWRAVHDIASSIIRISAVLEKGKLAPNPARQEQPPPEDTPEDDPGYHPDLEPAEPPQRANAPTSTGAAYEPNRPGQDDEDVPF